MKILKTLFGYGLILLGCAIFIGSLWTAISRGDLWLDSAVIVGQLLAYSLAASLFILPGWYVLSRRRERGSASHKQ